MSFQADQRFVWNGNLLRELAAQPEVTSSSAPAFLISYFANALITVTIFLEAS